MTNHRYFTRYLATKIIASGPVETCGIWPFEEKDTNFPEFIIGEDEYGKPVMFTCDPDLLANYFGANPDAPPLPHAGALPQRRTQEVLRQTPALLGRGRPPLVCPALECPD
jgi:hypothetical protein